MRSGEVVSPARRGTSAPVATPRGTILMVHDYPPVTGGGLALAVQELAGLLSDDFRFQVVSSRLVDHFADDRGIGRKPHEPPGDGLACEVVAPGRMLGQVSRADALLVHWTFSFRRLSTLALVIGPMLGKPIVCVIHTGPDHCDYNWVRRLPSTARRTLLSAARLLLQRCTAVIALGHTHADALARVGLPPTRVMPLPVTPTAPYEAAYEYHAAAGRSLTKIGIVGELSRLKGADEIPRLLEALTPRFAFRIVGRGPLSTQLARAVDGLSPAQRARILVTERLDPAQMPAFYREVDCLLVPSRTESQCRVALEAMLAGVLVLARRTLGISDLVADGRTGLLVDPGDPRSVLDALVRLADDPLEAAAIRQRACKLAREAFEQSYRDWQQFLRRLLA